MSDPRTGLVTGSAARVDAIGAALESAGYRVIRVTERAQMNEVCGDLPAGSLDAYVQLPGDVPAQGDTVVERSRSFLGNGLLARYDAAVCALPLLADDASVVLVAGNHPPAAALPDDQAARVALLRVLAHGILADRAPSGVRATVVAQHRTPEQIVQIVQDSGSARLRVLAEHVVGDTELSYADWRLEMLQLATLED